MTDLGIGLPKWIVNLDEFVPKCAGQLCYWDPYPFGLEVPPGLPSFTVSQVQAQVRNLQAFLLPGCKPTSVRTASTCIDFYVLTCHKFRKLQTGAAKLYSWVISWLRRASRGTWPLRFQRSGDPGSQRSRSQRSVAGETMHTSCTAWILSQLNHAMPSARRRTASADPATRDEWCQ